ncbi:MAG: class I SAM-dependent methyltransferase [Cytophagales bacterium]
MFEKIEKCPVCENTDFKNKMICEDYSISKEKFALQECSKCHFVFTSPRPDINNIGKYYDAENYISHHDQKFNLFTMVYTWVRNINLRYKYKIIMSYKKSGCVLDYGCGTGSFLEFMKGKGWKTIGVEVNDEARKECLKKNLDVFANLNNVNEKFDLITAWHVLEHVHDLNETIHILNEKLKRKGIMIVALPNHKSLDEQLYKEFWAGYDVPRHLYHFDTETFKKLMLKHDLKVKEIKPLWFDAFYVSILSEKYKKGGSLLSALKNAYRSNVEAKRTGNYSSLIYIIKKKNEKKN